MFSWERVVEYFPQILQKFPVTLEIVLVSFTAGILLGTILAMVRIKKIPVLSQIATVYISYVRCTPVICQMFVIYFGIPALVSSLGGDTTGIDNIVYVLIAYGINMGGFMGETIRAAILAVPSAQSEAGWTVGLTNTQTMVHIIAPQALRVALPMLGNTFISLFQATALAYMVGVLDMVGKARSLGSMSGHTLEGYLCCAAVFAVISLALERLFALVNRKLDFGRSASSSLPTPPKFAFFGVKRKVKENDRRELA